MAEKKLKNGLYWFTGYDRDDDTGETLIDKMFHDLGLYGSWNYSVGPSGYFYFEIGGPNSGRVKWVNSQDLTTRNRVIRTGKKLDIHSTHPLYYAEFADDAVEKTIVLRRGKTLCEKSCIFYYYCDGERDSSYNPSKIFGGCQEYKFNRNEIQVIKRGGQSSS